MKAVALVALSLASVLVAGAAFGTSPTPVKKAAIVAAPPAEVWDAWTTTEGIRAFFAPDGKIEAKPGGPYEIWFFREAPEASRGCDGCTVISVDPPKRLSFTWSFPPSIPELRDRGVLARVTVELLPGSLDGTTLVSLVHDGFPEGRPERGAAPTSTRPGMSSSAGSGRGSGTARSTGRNSRRPTGRSRPRSPPGARPAARVRYDARLNA